MGFAPCLNGQVGQYARPCNPTGTWGTEADQCVDSGADITVYAVTVDLVFTVALSDADVAAILVAITVEIPVIPIWRLFVYSAPVFAGGETTVVIGVTNNYLADPSSPETPQELADLIIAAFALQESTGTGFSLGFPLNTTHTPTAASQTSSLVFCDTLSIYQSSFSVCPNAAAADKKCTKDKKCGTYIAGYKDMYVIGAAIVIVVLLLSACCYCFCKSNSSKDRDDDDSKPLKKRNNRRKKRKDESVEFV
jgi:hypothetical protein